MPLPLLPQGTLDYTGISREDMLVRLQKLYNQVNPEWDDFSPAFPENLLLEGMVFIADLIRGTMEERVRQTSWATITDRLAAIRLARLSGFTLPNGSPATLTGTFALATGVASVSIPIDEGVVVRTKEAGTSKVYRVTSVGAEIAVGESSVDVNLEQAEVETDAFDSPLEPNLELLLDKSPYIDDSAVVTANDGAYTQYLTFLGATSTTKAFVVLVDDEGRARIRFGNGINGSIPQGTINIEYKVGGGTAGEVSANALWTIETPITDSLGGAVSLTFNNTASSQSGEDAMSVAEARVRGPQSLRNRYRGVSEEDYEYIATATGGVARAFMATSDTVPTVAEDYGRLEIVAYGTELASGRFKADTPSDAKLAEIDAALSKYSDTPGVLGFKYDVFAAELTTIDVSVRINKTSTVSAVEVKENIQNALDDFFAVSLDDKTPNTSIDFGAKLLGSDGNPDYLITWSSVFDAILAAEGVRYISSASNNLLLNNLHGSIRLGDLQFPILGTVTVYDQDQNGIQI